MALTFRVEVQFDKPLSDKILGVLTEVSSTDALTSSGSTVPNISILEGEIPYTSAVTGEKGPGDLFQDALTEALISKKKFRQFPVSIVGPSMGFFPSETRDVSTVFYFGVARSPDLENLRQFMIDEAVKVQMPVESGRWTPHVPYIKDVTTEVMSKATAIGNGLVGLPWQGSIIKVMYRTFDGEMEVDRLHLQLAAKSQATTGLRAMAAASGGELPGVLEEA